LLKLLTHIGMLSLVTKAIYNNGGSFTSWIKMCNF
jgi:hypothetical protein